MEAKSRAAPALRCAIASSLALPLLLSAPANAETAMILKRDDPRLTPARVITLDHGGFTQVVIDGYIHKPTVEAFRAKALQKGSEYGIVYFNSAGGDLSAAEELGRMIRAKGYATQIGKLSQDREHIGRGVCESACPIAFVGGKFRLLDTDTGRLGVHRFYLARQGRWASDSKLLFTAERDLRKYLEEMGISSEFFELMMKTPADQIRPIDKPAIYDWRLGTGAEFSSWQKTADGQLVGLGETSTGGMAMSFKCSDGALHAQVRFKPWFPPAALLNFEVHSITVNGARFPVEEVKAGYEKSTGVLTFDTQVGADAAKAFGAAEKVGYSLSYEHLPGEYSRALHIDDQGKPLSALATSCSAS